MNEVIQSAQQQLTAPVPGHQHESWELCLCLEGEGRCLLGGQEMPLRPGTLCVIPPDTPHGLDGAGMRCCLLQIGQAALTFRQPILLEDDENQSLLHLFLDADYHFHTGDASRPALLSGYGQLIVQHVSARRPSSPRSQLVEDIAQNIVQNYANPNYELDALLRSAPYCYDYLCRLFRQELHTTPHKYLLDLRMQSAAEALRGGSGSSVTEIARQCGYSDPLYFSRMFKRKFGLSPREYARGK